jgi:hypothetical protein
VQTLRGTTEMQLLSEDHECLRLSNVHTDHSTATRRR